MYIVDLISFKKVSLILVFIPMLLNAQFVLTKEGFQPIVSIVDSMTAKQIYEKAIKWVTCIIRDPKMFERDIPVLAITFLSTLRQKDACNDLTWPLTSIKTNRGIFWFHSLTAGVQSVGSRLKYSFHPTLL